MKKNLFDLILVCCLLQACVSNVDLEMPLQKSIVLNGLLVPGDTISVSLHRSGTNTDTIEFKTIDNAKVTLFENEISLSELKYRGAGHYSSSIIAKELTSYKITVETPEQEKAWAETTTPEANFGAKIHTPKELDSLQNNWPYFLTLTDNPGTINNYWVCNKRYEFTPDSVTHRELSFALNSNSVYIDQFNVTYDPEGYGKYYLEYDLFMHIDDKEFNGETITVDFYPSNSGASKQDSVIVFSTDEHYSNYLKSKLINEEGGNYLTENGPPISYQPAFLYTNVNGGMGILGSYTTYTKTYQYK